jgi:hypothetical protein
MLFLQKLCILFSNLYLLYQVPQVPPMASPFAATAPLHLVWLDFIAALWRLADVAYDDEISPDARLTRLADRCLLSPGNGDQLTGRLAALAQTVPLFTPAEVAHHTTMNAHTAGGAPLATPALKLPPPPVSAPLSARSTASLGSRAISPSPRAGVPQHFFQKKMC